MIITKEFLNKEIEVCKKNIKIQIDKVNEKKNNNYAFLKSVVEHTEFYEQKIETYLGLLNELKAGERSGKS